MDNNEQQPFRFEDAVKIDLEDFYSLRNRFIVIALTGRIGVGFREITEVFSSDKSPDMQPEDVRDPQTRRKLRILNSYLKSNWKQFKIIRYKKVILLFLLQYPFDELLKFLKTRNDNSTNFSDLELLKEQFESYKDIIQNLKKPLYKINEETDLEKLKDLFFDDLIDFDTRFYNCFDRGARGLHLLHDIGNNIRRTGKPYLAEGEFKLKYTYRISQLINRIIKAYRNSKGNERREALFIIDAVKNPFELVFFKERYSSFYTIGVHLTEEEREKIVKERFNGEGKIIDKKEIKSNRNELWSQSVSRCLQYADIHIWNTNKDNEQIVNASKRRNDDFLNVKQQIGKYISLILHPGLVTPSPQERCMQFALTSKLNSGCISRQVGAVVTEKNFSILSTGWNDVAKGQVPCVLRSAQDLYNQIEEQESSNNDFHNEYHEIDEYSTYEIKDEKFKNAFKKYYQLLDNQKLEGRNCSFCFKDIQYVTERKENQVHTRSLHAEENAFFQVMKNGASLLEGGILFTTASPCELCSKKAYQLGISKIYFIDPYPGISKPHVIETGYKNRPELIVFNGAIGRAYHKLYEPMMSYKDELNLLTGINFKKPK